MTYSKIACSLGKRGIARAPNQASSFFLLLFLFAKFSQQLSPSPCLASSGVAKSRGPASTDRPCSASMAEAVLDLLADCSPTASVPVAANAPSCAGVAASAGAQGASPSSQVSPQA
ncbi:uncharacterized protein UMAG_11813 [Mycosarcoma maydis]|uniref:Ustilagic acid biosynthesis cluster protein orf3 n=1 Tax=Mycosarcoma maydis TaxID=5270 RepID=ORF3_MYCMD|nr:uncharacterized protein UMAG_11813 [Ustilago maydis 521]A0A0D1DMK2.1 RecName: Full=Ustilagic acid biosynthesis cluster protein orf3; Flags: Precursor [Ustilago maydis 521]KIS65764.1 hypothetical protein UMAG_11813 [Ustilago maydis 521]|eukprot:XP_011392750.1 hypothetical protein UMAG_11813 [Ustilago maydis 521]